MEDAGQGNTHSRHIDARISLKILTCLEDKHLDLRILGESSSQDKARCTTTDNHIVE